MEMDRNDNIIFGEIIINEFGIGFVNTIDKTIYINKQNLNRAYNGELVQVEIINSDEGKYYGKVINFSLVNRIFVGQVHHIYKDDIYICSKKLTKSNLIVIKSDKIILNKNDWVKVKVISDVNNKINGELIKVINNNIDTIIQESFNLSLLDKISNMNNNITNFIESERKDLTNLYTFTIDPQKCRDCDDAFSIECINNKIHIYVHISDVAHYINPCVPEFDEIIKRGSTVYGINNNWTMIPELYSNYVCSILPNKNTYVHTNEFVFDETENSIKYINSYYSVIKSVIKFTYENVYDDIFIYDILNKTAKIIQSEIKDLNLTETNNDLIDTHDMVKFWMIKVNQIMSKKIQKIYRCHSKPYINQLVLLQNYLDYKKIEMDINRETIYNLLSQERNNNILNFIIKSILPKAYYSLNDNSHYALGINNYTHWTSPIRRGCDLLNHCILKGYDFDKIKLLKYIEYLNASDKLQYQIEKFMVEHNIDSNKIYEGTIINILRTGIVLFVHELNTKYTIHISKLSNDTLFFDNNILFNEKHEYKLYDIIHIKINDNFEFTII